jgi:hypothetical protein
MDVTVSLEAEARLLVKLQTDALEVNVWASTEDISRLGHIRSADWNARRSIHAGESAGAQVHWASMGDQVTLMIGHDDETWDVAITMPIQVVDEIVRDAQRLGL